ncbi:hypothetical protein P5G61_12890 [Paenibacillus sp. F6_3S_P_1C]|uniref:Uncharacterized protein n=1 Tax=Paenibacillus vandeheii TaxID=3035917 RepID=A0ABT8JAL0_9BACL|nr:hypothetical protein [Paenibacillus vandeheii]MDN4602126.1 hypothetical protein [Paenibacillus vandeheii]
MAARTALIVVLSLTIAVKTAALCYLSDQWHLFHYFWGAFPGERTIPLSQQLKALGSGKIISAHLAQF